MEFEKVIRERSSIRKFSKKKFDISYILEAIEAANLAPSPGNLPLIRYIIVENSEKISKLAEASMQSFIADAPFIVVVCSDKKEAELLYEERAERYVKHHVGAAIENFLLKITDLGLASCWIGAFSDLMVKNILKIPANIEVEALLPVAYKAETLILKRRPKPPLDPRIYFEEWKNKFQKPPKKLRADVQ